MAYNVEELRQLVDEVARKGGAELMWDPSHQTQSQADKSWVVHLDRTEIKRINRLHLHFRIYREKQEGDEDAFISPQRRMEMICKLLASKLFDFFEGDEPEFMVTIGANVIKSELWAAKTPEEMAQLLFSTTRTLVGGKSIICDIRISTPIRPNAVSEEQTTPSDADLVDRFANYVMAEGAHRRLFVDVSHDARSSWLDPGVFTAIIQSKTDRADDSLAPLKVRIRSFARALMSHLSSLTERGATFRLIDTGSSPHVTAQDICQKIIEGYGTSGRADLNFKVGFIIIFPDQKSAS